MQTEFIYKHHYCFHHWKSYNHTSIPTHLFYKCSLHSARSWKEKNYFHAPFHPLQKDTYGSSHCGATGLGASLQRQDTGSTLGPGQHVKGSGIAVGCSWGWDLIPGPGTPYAKGRSKKKGERGERKGGGTDTCINLRICRAAILKCLSLQEKCLLHIQQLSLSNLLQLPSVAQNIVRITPHVIMKYSEIWGVYKMV